MLMRIVAMHPSVILGRLALADVISAAADLDAMNNYINSSVSDTITPPQPKPLSHQH